MQKIMFNETYGLTEAVLQGRKTMTRRLISKHFPAEGVELIGITGIGAEFRIGDNYEPVFVRLPYKVGEVVAVAQNYQEAINEFNRLGDTSGWGNLIANTENGCAGYYNKMFVRADLMPHRIRITDIKVERLQDISDEDCLKEGIRIYTTGILQCKTQVVGSLDFIPPYGFDDYNRKQFSNFDTLHEAFAALIDKVSGRGTWKANPWVFAYTYELVK